MKSARVTISRVFGGSKTFMSLTIEDEASSLRVIRLAMTLEDFATCITGQGHIPAEVEAWIGKNANRIGMEREGRTVSLSGRPPFGKDESKKWVSDHPELILADGWELHDDGTSAQQNDRDRHRISLVRYVKAAP